MKIAIITSPERKEKDLALLEEAKKIFDSALLVSIDNIKLGIGNELKAFYKKTDLSSFDIVLPLPTFIHKEFYYTCMKILEKNCLVPIESDKFFMLCNKALMLKAMQEKGIKVRKTFIVALDSVASNIIKELKLPLIATPSSKNRILVTNEDTLKGVMSLFKPGYMTRLEKPIKTVSSIWCFVVGNDVVASYEEIGDKRRSMNVGDDARTIVKKVVSIIKTDFCAINFLRTKKSLIVNSVTVCPDFSTFQKVTGKNVMNSLLLNLKETAELERMSPIQRMFVDIQDFFRRLLRV